MSLLKQISESFRFRIVSSFLLVLLPALIVLAVAVQYFLIPSMRQGIKEELTNSTRVLTGTMRASSSALIRNHLKAIAEQNREIASQHLSLVDQGVLTREEAVKRLRSIFLSQQIGRSGYIYCLDHSGNVPIHPNKDVENTNATGFEFVREQLERKEGYIEYDWQNPGEKSARSKALYMVYFEPLDWIISVSSYRDEFNELIDLKDFRDAVSSLKFGKSGYAYVFSKEGKILLHPVFGYLTDLSTIDPATDVLKPMLSQDSGVVEYEWRNPEEPQARKKIAVFETVPEYGWIVVSSAYLDEVMAPVDLLVRLGYISIFVVFMATGIATFLLSGRLSRPIDAMLHQLDENTKSGVHKPLPTHSHDEIGRLAQEFNNFFTVIHTQAEQLRKERERYQSLFETSPDAVFLMQRMKIIDCNPATCDIFAGSREAILGRSVVDLSPPFQGSNIPSSFLAEKITGQLPEKCLQVFDWVHQTVDGRPFDAEVRLKPFGDDDGEMLIVAFVRDITKRKRAEEALLLTQFIFDKASVGIFRSGADARILNVNEQACKSLGYTREELCQLSLYDIDPALSQEQFKELRQKRVEESVVEFESSHRAKNGYVFPVHISSNLLEYQGEQFSISFVRDISEEKNNEKQKAIMEAHLQQAQRMEALGTLAGGVAHDFNNILTAIIGYTDLTKLASQENPQIQAYLSQLQSASLRAKNLVKQILSFSKQGNLEKRPIDISQVLNEALDLFKGSIPASIELYQHIKADLGTVIANETQIHQVIMNLCTNACHAMGKEGGRLEIDLVPVSITDSDAIHYPDLTPGQYLKLVVIDTGHGISADDLANIFEPYFTTKPMGEGTGLGLSTVHGIVKDHGGDIKVYSEVNVGTTFQIFLPLVDSETEPSLLSESDLLRGTETILYVDDEKYLIDLGKELLEGLGYVVETRASSIDAWEAFQVHPEKYDLVITDMTMPQLSGMELAVKVLEVHPDMPIILCTGFSTRLNTDRLKGIGVKKVLMKPVTLMELSVAIREVLDAEERGHRG
jgi:PAS domain S-box-containing protein